MEHRASLSLLVLLLGFSQALPLTEDGDREWMLDDQDTVDITTRILATNKGSSEVLTEGDLVKPRAGNAMKCQNDICLWGKNFFALVQVPYTVSRDFNYYDKMKIQKAMKTFHSKTCIRFVPRSSQSDYISIENKDGCYSYVGRIGGKQVLSLKKRGCVYHGIIQHELNHALGFLHEQSRSDRDKYIGINWDNIESDNSYNFDRHDTINLNTPYDYSSVMHYGRTAFSINGQDTITPIPDSSLRVGQRQDMSNLDILRINRLYGCRTTITYLKN